MMRAMFAGVGTFLLADEGKLSWLKQHNAVIFICNNSVNFCAVRVKDKLIAFEVKRSRVKVTMKQNALFQQRHHRFAVQDHLVYYFFTCLC